MAIMTGLAIASAVAGAAGSYMGKKKAAAKSKTTTEYKMTPQQKAMIARMTELSARRLSGIKTPEEQRQIATAATQADVGAANAISMLGNPESGQSRGFQQQIAESAVANRIGATNKIESAHYDQAYNSGLQMALKGPTTGMSTTVPQNNSAAIGQGASDLGTAMTMGPYLDKGVPDAAGAPGAAAGVGQPGGGQMSSGMMAEIMRMFMQGQKTGAGPTGMPAAGGK